MAPSATLGLSDPFSSSPFCSLLALLSVAPMLTAGTAACHNLIVSPRLDCIAPTAIPQPACCSFAHNDLVGERGDACSYENPPHVVYSLCRVRYERPRPCRWILTLPHEVRPVLIWSAAISFVSEDHGVSCVLNVPRSSITCFDCVSARTSCPPLTAQ